MTISAAVEVIPAIKIIPNSPNVPDPFSKVENKLAAPAESDSAGSDWQNFFSEGAEAQSKSFVEAAAQTDAEEPSDGEGALAAAQALNDAADAEVAEEQEEASEVTTSLDALTSTEDPMAVEEPEPVAA